MVFSKDSNKYVQEQHEFIDQMGRLNTLSWSDVPFDQ